MQNASDKKIEINLAKALSSSEEGEVFIPKKFFANWLRGDHSSAHLFLFRKNLKVTNIQFAELLALLRTHTREGDKPIHDLQFLSVSEFKNGIRDIVEAFPRQRFRRNDRYKLIAKLYSPLFRRTVVVDSFFGSCAVFLPSHLTVDLKAICAYSGYIHSCGHNIFIRKVEKTKKEAFLTALDRHLKKYTKKDKPIFFSVYSHEDFTNFDRERADYLRDGLDDVKIYAEKFYMDTERLVLILKEMRTRYENKLEIPDPGNRKGMHKSLRDIQKIDPTRTIWLFTDHSIDKDLKHPGEEVYFICYEQQFMNENPFFIFDENKPAWTAPTTIPHTLLAAMINIAETLRDEHKKIVLTDPFVGTGTSWLEAIKYPNLDQQGSDKTEIAPLLVADNLEFFSLSPEELTKLENNLFHLAKPPERAYQKPDFAPDTGETYSIDFTEIDRAYEWAISLFKTLDSVRDVSSLSESKKTVDKLKSKSLAERLLFYLALRTALKNIAAFEQESIDWVTAYRKEAGLLATQIHRLVNLKAREEERTDQLCAFSIIQGSHSRSCTISFDKIAKMYRELQGAAPVTIQDVRYLKARSCDIIITDPPYGFNTDDKQQDLAELYTDMIRVMITALKEEGQLIMCLADRSRTGRRSAYFTHKELILRQVLTVAEETDREVTTLANIVPPARELFRIPYYWESERTLRRAILHFRIRDRR